MEQLSSNTELIINNGIKLCGLSNINFSQEIHYLIYKITNNVNGHYYIGQHRTTNPYDNYLGSGKMLWKEAYPKYGISSFTKEILYDLKDADALNIMEKKLVPLSACYPNNKLSYNLAEGGGKYPVLSGENNPMYGIDVRTLMSTDAVKKMSRKRSIALKNRKRKQSTFDKISIANSGRNNPMYKKAVLKNKKCVFCLATRKYSYIPVELVQEYLKNGYILQGSNHGTKHSKEHRK